MDVTIHFRLHHKSLLAAGIAVVAFALPIIGVPKNLAWALVALGLALSVLAVLVWLHERRKAAPKKSAPLEVEAPVTKPASVSKPLPRVKPLSETVDPTNEGALGAARRVAQLSAPRSRLALAAAGGPAQPLIYRGETLLSEVKELRKPVDPHRAQYEPQAGLFKEMSRASRYMIGAMNLTNVWLGDVARFVSEEAPARSPELYPEPVKSLPTEQAAIERNLAVLREIAQGILSPRVPVLEYPTPEELQAATILAAKHDQAVLSAYRDILRIGRALLDELGATLHASKPATADLRSRTEAWFKRCGEWASGNLTPEQRARMGFDGAPSDSTADGFYLGLLARYVNALEATGEELGLLRVRTD